MNNDTTFQVFVIKLKSLGNALERLERVLQMEDIDVHDYLRDAAIQRFEFTIELFWKALKKGLYYEKIESTTPRDVVAKAFQFYLIGDEAIWLKMLDDRNISSHVYSEEQIEEIFKRIKTYTPILRKTYDALVKKYGIML